MGGLPDVVTIMEGKVRAGGRPRGQRARPHQGQVQGRGGLCAAWPAETGPSAPAALPVALMPLVPGHPGAPGRGAGGHTYTTRPACLCEGGNRPLQVSIKKKALLQLQGHFGLCGSTISGALICGLSQFLMSHWCFLGVPVIPAPCHRDIDA